MAEAALAPQEEDFFELGNTPVGTPRTSPADDFFEIGDNVPAKLSPLVNHGTSGYLESLGTNILIGAAKDMQKTGEVPSLFRGLRAAGGLVKEGAELGVRGVARLEGRVVAPFLSDENVKTLQEKLPEQFPSYPEQEKLRKFMAGEAPLPPGETAESLMIKVAAEQINEGPIGDVSAIAHPIMNLLTPLFNTAVETYQQQDIQAATLEGTPVDAATAMAEAKTSAFVATLNVLGVATHAGPVRSKIEALKNDVGFSEDVFMGIKPKTPEEAKVVQDAEVMLEPQKPTEIAEPMATQAVAEAQPATPARPATVHEAARNVAPEVFKEYDALETKRDNYARYVRELSDKRAADAVANAPNTAKIAALDEQIKALQEAKKGGYGKVQSLIAKREELQKANQLAIDEAVAKDTPDIAQAREAYLKTDARMRDMAPQVSEAYRTARENMPELETIEPPKAEFEEPRVEAPAEPEPLTPEQSGAKAIEETAKAEEVQRTVAEEVEKRLIEAGRAPEIAKEDATLTAAFFKTMADMYQGKKGSDLEWYLREGADVRKGRDVEGSKNPPRGKIQLASDNARAVIRLFKKQDASTFMHESAHDFLDIMERYATKEGAPERLVADVGAIRKYLGVAENALLSERTAKGTLKYVREHEKFARSFERYLMEGVAPSKELAGVFAKFKKWLTDIYLTVQKLRAPITPEIRAVFDRMLATDPQRVVIASEFEKPKSPMKSSAPELPIVTLKPNEPVYAKVEKTPLTLKEWVKKNGGLLDDGGDVLQMIGGKRGFESGLIKDTGRALDYLAVRAWEDGYFPEKTERPTINEFLERLSEDVSGKEQFSKVDAEKVTAVKAARAYNTEVDKLAAEFGIDTANKTRQQFWDEVAEKTSAAEQERLNTDIEDARKAEQEEFDRLEKEWVESRGDSWEPLETKTRTLEDLENERKQEGLAGEPEQGAGRAAEQGRTGETEGSGGEAVREGGGGTEPAGRTGAAKPEKQRLNPDGSFVKPEPILDKNGGVKYDLLEKRIEKLDIDQNWADFIRNTAAEIEPEITEARRGVVSQAQTMALAEAMGRTDDLLFGRKLGQAFNATELKVAEATFKALSLDAFNKSKLEPTLENMAAFAAANQKFIAATAQFLGAASEAGRALNILKTLSAELKQAKNIQELFQRSMGKSADDIAAQMDFMSKLDSPEQIAKFAQATRKATGREMMMEYWKNSILSGPVTQAVNLTSNMLTALLSVPETYATAVVGKVLGSEKRVYMGEGTARLQGLMGAIPDAIKVAQKYFKDNNPYPEGTKINEAKVTKAIPGKVGDIVRLPYRLLGSVDMAFKTIASRQELRQLAYREARDLGLTDSWAISSHITKRLENPPEAWMEQAIKAADYQTFQKELGKLGNSVIAVSNAVPEVGFIVPFVRTPANILKYAGERTPLAGVNLLVPFSQELKANLSGINGTIARDTAIGRMVVGTSLMTMTAMYAKQGYITGGGPKDPNERRLWLQTHQPYSVKLGNRWVSYNRFEPFGTIMGISADMVAISNMESHEKDSVAALMFASISKNLVSKTWLQGPADLIQAIEQQERYGGAYASNLISSAVPNLVRQTFGDEYLRDADTLMEKVKSRIPGWSQTLEQKVDVWGNPVRRTGLVGDARKDAVSDKLAQVGYYPSPVKRDIYSVKLTDKQYFDYATTAGKLSRQAVERLFQQEGFFNKPREVQQALVKKRIGDAREAARSVIKAKYPDIIRQAIKNKQMVYSPLREE